MPYRDGCNGKRRFASESEARKSANCIRRHSEERMHPYLCEYCSGYHIGHHGPALRRKRLVYHEDELRSERKAAGRERKRPPYVELVDDCC